MRPPALSWLVKQFYGLLSNIILYVVGTDKDWFPRSKQQLQQSFLKNYQKKYGLLVNPASKVPRDLIRNGTTCNNIK